MFILAKAKQNLQAASFLIEKNFYAPSVHCSYYASFQMSKRKLLESGISYEQQDSDARGRKQDSHFYTIESTENCFSDSIRASNYRHNMFKLRRLRKKSDYQNEAITKDEAEEAKKITFSNLELLGDH